MRAALLTTLVVLLCLVVYAEYRRSPPPENAADAVAERTQSAPAGAPGGLLEPAPRTDPAAASIPSDASTRYETAAAAQPTPLRRHLVRPGDTLASLAARYYGDPARGQEIYEANRDRIRDPERLHDGQELLIP
ncbi:MAG TPA: LysM peptidoglycan-binding domain-containing protein [Nitrospira sp.]|nr:LysM peptidoglycan-binding domain-containing protein [Nitrospira sp.]